MNMRTGSRLLLVPVALLVCCTSSKRMDTDIASLSHELMVPLPSDARVLGVERQSGLDDMVRAKVEMSRAAFDRILAQLPMARASFSRGKGRLGADHGFWNPGATPDIRYAQAPLAEGRVLHVGYADSSHDRVVLFIVNHGT